MINRGNWKLVKKYLTYREEVHQLGISSVNLEKNWLKHILEWAGQTPFLKASKIRPALPTYIVSARKDGTDAPLSPAYVEKIIGSAKRLFSWLRLHETGYSSLKDSYLDTLRPPKQQGRSNKFVAVTLEEMLEIAAAPVENVEERRIRAAACFWFLSGIRIGAFVTLPISAINLSGLEIKQWPELGVKTKFRKRETTYLLRIPKLLGIVRDWDQEIRQHLDSYGYWFAPISVKSGLIESEHKILGNHRDSRARKSLSAWLKRVNIPYKRPHSFRHGHAVYAIKLAKDIKDLKAISRNLMHGSIQITDSVYGVLSDNDIEETISKLGSEGNLDKRKLKQLLTEMIDDL